MFIRVKTQTRDEKDVTPPRVELGVGDRQFSFERGTVYEVTSLEGRAAVATGLVEPAEAPAGQKARTDEEIEAARAAAAAKSAPPATTFGNPKQQAEQNQTTSAASATSEPPTAPPTTTATPVSTSGQPGLATSAVAPAAPGVETQKP